MLSDDALSWLKLNNIGNIETVSRFDNALTNAVFLITNNTKQSFIFKILNRNARSDEDRKCEYLVQQLAAQQNLTPIVLAHNKSYKLQRFIEGKLIDENRNNICDILATQFHRIHQLPALHAPKQRLAFELHRLKAQLPITIDEAIFHRMLTLAIALDEQSTCDTLCHGDLSLNNLLQTPDKEFYVLDWEYAVIACEAYDLAFCNCINGFNQQKSQMLIETYHSKMSLSKRMSVTTLQNECQLYLKIFQYINELWSICFMEKSE